ncbi:MAG: 16S rRNA (guanine(527)-N(7))-methyltransferase RsmG [Lachnospiraceae bacterium]|nr:16S rRNA (guanine(527)-N(7))-methyltransferase RsmG [Lachnospiraceae bacterium]MDY4969019.1 16S rRNA (guanine(527)-N(7))-methyltransferase RsmG [Lachnospiraceae bacterium]
MEYLKSVFEKHGFALTDRQAQQFRQYYDMLVEKNKVMNLTAITEYREVVVKHFLDSVYLGKYADLSGSISVIDVGTGAGFPGIPLKIMYPEMKMVLLDSLNKRIRFLQDVINELALDQVEAVHGRAEEVARKADYREQFDYCVSRAVANLNSLSEICLPFVKIGGSFISYKSMKGMEELEQAKKAICLLGGNCMEGSGAAAENSVERFILEEESAQVETMERNFIRINKIKATPRKYPRKPGTPFKEPLK